MRKIMTAAVAALTIGGALAASVPASAQNHYDRGYRHNDDGAAVAAGVAGLAIGAAIASGDRGPAPYYYNAPPPAYYNGPAYYSYYGHCHTSCRWSPHWGRYVRVRGCY